MHFHCMDTKTTQVNAYQLTTYNQISFLCSTENRFEMIRGIPTFLSLFLFSFFEVPLVWVAWHGTSLETSCWVSELEVREDFMVLTLDIYACHFPKIRVTGSRWGCLNSISTLWIFVSYTAVNAEVRRDISVSHMHTQLFFAITLVEYACMLLFKNHLYTPQMIIKSRIRM